LILLGNNIASFKVEEPAQEAAFEAIRAALPPYNGVDMIQGCSFGYTPCELNWRPLTKKVPLILAEHSDFSLRL
jgi:hypothetical protein